MNHELTEQELTQWKGIITDVLRAFHEICEKYGLTYYAIGGTAIGAVRHQGIIPWDDDIDVGMPRPDFERFVEICRTTDFGDYELVSDETHEATTNWCRTRRTRPTTCRSPSSARRIPR